LGGAKIPDALIAVIHAWIQQGLIANAASQPKRPAVPSIYYHPSDLNRPKGVPAMPESLPPVIAAEWRVLTR